MQDLYKSPPCSCESPRSLSQKWDPFQFRMKEHQPHRERCQLVSTGEKKRRRKREEWIKDIGKLPRGAGVCLTTGWTSVSHAPGKCGPAWAGPADYGKTNQAYMANTQRAGLCVGHTVSPRLSLQLFSASLQRSNQDLRHSKKIPKNI